MAARKKKKPRFPAVSPPIVGARWVKLRSELLESRLDPSRLDVELVDSLVINLMQAANAWEVASREPFTEGSRGQEVAHPGFAVASRCEMSALALAKHLEVGVGTGEEGVEDTVRDELAEIRARKIGAA